MKNPRYLTDEDIQKLISLRGIRRPCELARDYKIGLARLYKIWSKSPSGSAITAGEPTEYINAKKIYMERKKS